MEILGYSMALADERRKNPQRRHRHQARSRADERRRRGLTDDEFGFFVILLAVAGNETTRNAITHGMHAFFENPDQWELYKRERPATDGRRDHPLGHAGHGLPAHRDQRRRGRRRAGRRRASGSGCSTPAPTSTRTSSTTRSRFDITRDPNPHLAFGGHGAHYCIGANLARLEVNLIFNALADLAPDIRQLGEPRRLRHGWINGIKDLQVAYR